MIELATLSPDCVCGNIIDLELYVPIMLNKSASTSCINHSRHVFKHAQIQGLLSSRKEKRGAGVQGYKLMIRLRALFLRRS